MTGSTTLRLIRSLIGIAMLLCAKSGLAHKASDAYLGLIDGGNTITLYWEVPLRDLALRLELDRNGDHAVSAREVRASHPAIEALLSSALAVSRAGRPCPWQVESHAFTRRQDEVMVRPEIIARCEQSTGPITVDYRLFAKTDPSHRGLLYAANSASALVLVPGAGPILVPTAGQHGLRQTLDQAWTFFIDGARHIFQGYDHLAFLVALLLPAALLRKGSVWVARDDRWAAALEVTGLVTAFTVAHSITLVLGALGWISLPGAPVEMAIAASVVLAAINNIKPLIRGRLWIMAFGFGLIHGFGFASSLADTGLPQQGQLTALLSFNLGVEAAQLAIVLAIAPLLWWLRSQATYRRITLPMASCALALAGLLWMLQRSGVTS